MLAGELIGNNRSKPHGQPLPFRLLFLLLLYLLQSRFGGNTHTPIPYPRPASFRAYPQLLKLFTEHRLGPGYLRLYPFFVRIWSLFLRPSPLFSTFFRDWGEPLAVQRSSGAVLGPYSIRAQEFDIILPVGMYPSFLLTAQPPTALLSSCSR